MNKTLKSLRLSQKQWIDVHSMAYFIPSGSKQRIYPNDFKKMALYSATGKLPDNQTRGFKLLLWGKTYRDEQITSYIRDIRLGYFTKHELIQSMPHFLRDWLARKIEHVPYDEDGDTSAMLIGLYRKGDIQG